MNLDRQDFDNFFYPQLIYILTAKTGKNKAVMSPIKWITPICRDVPMIAMSLLEGNIANSILKAKCFTISMVSEDFITDTLNLIKMPVAGQEMTGINYAKITRFGAEQAFFIDSFKVRSFPWVECKVNKFLKLPGKTILVAAKIIHMSKKEIPLEKRIMHYKDDLFLFTRKLTVRKVTNYNARDKKK